MLLNFLGPELQNHYLISICKTERFIYLNCSHVIANCSSIIREKIQSQDNIYSNELLSAIETK